VTLSVVGFVGFVKRRLRCYVAFLANTVTDSRSRIVKNCDNNDSRKYTVADPDILIRGGGTDDNVSAPS